MEINSVIGYTIPENWMCYDILEIVEELTLAKAAVISLTTIPYQREWAVELEQIQLKREVAGTSKIEGADFTDRELEAALRETAEQILTRSQKQARAALQTYKWIAKLEDDRPVDAALIKEVHRRIVTGADDDHCEPGAIRGLDNNVTFGVPRHRGANGGDECAKAFESLTRAASTEFRRHDKLIQALALHYHLAAMHPFQDGNGRTARALEALMLQRAGLRDSLFIAMSNFYYDEKTEYLKILAEVRAKNYNLTPFLKFGLRGIATQCQRLFGEIRNQVSKALFRNVMFDLFTRLQTTKKRVIAERQIEILKVMLKKDIMEVSQLIREVGGHYRGLKAGRKAIVRDLTNLLDLNALRISNAPGKTDVYEIRLNLDWPTEITDSAFFEKVKKYPKAKTHPFLQ